MHPYQSVLAGVVFAWTSEYFHPDFLFMEGAVGFLMGSLSQI